MTEHNKAIPEISVDSQTILNRLKIMKKGEVVTYAELSRLISADVTKAARYNLTTARRRLLMDEGMVFESVRGVGVKRMDDAQIITIGEQSERKLHRISRNAMRKLSCANMDNLTNEQRVELHTHASVVGTIALVTKPSKVKLIKAAVQQSENRIPLNKTLEIFKT